MTSSKDKPPRPDGLQLFQLWLTSEGSKGWDALDTAPDSSYEKVWAAWLKHLEGKVRVSKKPLAHQSISFSIKQDKLSASSSTKAKPKLWHEATAVDVQRFLKVREGQRAHHQPERQISQVTRRRYWRLLERIYEHACEQHWISVNPAVGLKPGERPPSEDGKGHCLPALLWQALPRHFPAADGYQDARDRAILLLLYELALAPEEVRVMLWRDVLDEQKLVCTSDSSALPCFLHIDGARAAQQRTIALPENVAQALMDWRRFSAGQRGPEVIAPQHLVFYSRRGGDLSVRMLFHVASQIIQRAHQALSEDKQKAPLQRVGPQVLRNTAIVQWLNAGRSEQEVIEQIGVESNRALRHLRHYILRNE